MSAINYSKWDHIEVSDDEDDVHPNIDTPSLFRWRHTARVDRMETEKQEKDEFKKGYTDHQRKLMEMKQKIKEAEANTAADELEKMKLEVGKLEKQERDWKKKEEELKKKERMAPQNIDTLCKEGKTKTIINKYTTGEKELTDDERMNKQSSFTEKYEKEIKKLGMLQKYEDTEAYLKEHTYLVCEETSNYLVLWCIELETQEKHDLMHHVAHQTIVMQFILELAKSLKIDPRGCVKAFFSRTKLGEQQYMGAFNDELDAFKGRIEARAKVRLQEAMREVEEEERQARLGPGGLDPVEVFAELPKELQDCFESKDIPMLEKVLMAMPKEEANHYLQQCIDSGMWVPNAKEAEEAALRKIEREAAGKAATSDDDEDEIYETPSESPASPDNVDS